MFHKIRIHPNTPQAVQSTITGSFAAPAGCVLAACFGSNGTPTGFNTAPTDSVGLTWNKVASYAYSNSFTAVWIAACPSAQSSMTVTHTNASVMSVLVLTGASSTPGASATASVTSGLPGQSLVTTGDGSLIIMGYSQWATDGYPVYAGTPPFLLIEKRGGGSEAALFIVPKVDEGRGTLVNGWFVTGIGGGGIMAEILAA